MRYEVKLKDGIFEAKDTLLINNIEDEATSERAQQPNNKTRIQSKNNYIQPTKFVEDFVAQSLEELSSSSSDEGLASERDKEIAEVTKMNTNPLVQTLEDIIQPLADLKVDDGKHYKRISNLPVPFISTHDAQQCQQLKRELHVKIIEEANTLVARWKARQHIPVVQEEWHFFIQVAVMITKHMTKYPLVDIVGIDSIGIGNLALELIKLMEFSGRRIVLALEGGYNLGSLADSFLEKVVGTTKHNDNVQYVWESQTVGKHKQKGNRSPSSSLKSSLSVKNA
eukprot:Gb_02708 [translate_table: standard]